MLEYDWENSVGFWICMTAHELRKSLGALLACEGITLRQWEVLACLSCRGCNSQAELAEHLSIEPHTVAGVLNRMEVAGWIVRKPCENDRRRMRIEPTEAAERVWKRVTEICHEMRAQAVAGLSDAEIALLKKTCAKIRDNIATGGALAIPASLDIA